MLCIPTTCRMLPSETLMHYGIFILRLSERFSYLPRVPR